MVSYIRDNGLQVDTCTNASDLYTLHYTILHRQIETLNPALDMKVISC